MVVNKTWLKTALKHNHKELEQQTPPHFTNNNRDKLVYHSRLKGDTQKKTIKREGRIVPFCCRFIFPGADNIRKK